MERERGPKLGVKLMTAQGAALISRWSAAAAATQDTIAEQRGSAQAEAHPAHTQHKPKKKERKPKNGRRVQLLLADGRELAIPLSDQLCHPTKK